jgi:predicted metal-dependent hydrolase
VQFELNFSPWQAPRNASPENWLRLGSKHIKLHLIRNRQARRYVLRLRSDGTARITIPRGGTTMEAKRFAEKNAAWLERQMLRLAKRPKLQQSWFVGTHIVYRGEHVRLEADNSGSALVINFATERLKVKDPNADLRPEIEHYLLKVAQRELPKRVFDLAALHQIALRHVTVRNQRSRWGSCSQHGTVSLNWRLVQTPDFVRDYIILHELAHFRHMNHSQRFWNEVAHLCPGFAQAEQRLKENGRGLLGECRSN